MRSTPWSPWARLALAGALLLTLAGGAAALTVSRAERSTLERGTQLALKNFSTHHYGGRPVESLAGEEVVDAYLRFLDPQRMILTEPEAVLLRERFGPSLHSAYLRQGNLFPALEIFRAVSDRQGEWLTWIKQRLNEPFDFAAEDHWRPDRDEAPRPVRPAEAELLWTRRLQHEVVQEILAGRTEAEARERVRRRHERALTSLRELGAPELQEIFLSSLAGLLDPHSSFYSAESLEDFSIDLRNTLVGIGALLRDEDGEAVIQQLLPGSPAERSGRISPGDRILAVADGAEGGEAVEVTGMSLRKVVRLIRGEPGSTVRLTLQSSGVGGTGERKVVAVVRDRVQLTARLAKGAVHELVEGGRTVVLGVIELPSFYGAPEGAPRGGTTKDVEDLIELLKPAGIEGLVLDLRENSGGLLSEAIGLTGLFIRRGPVVRVREGDGTLREDWDRSAKVAWDGPLVVLTSRRSASASEIVAGALQDHRRALIVGDRATHGKGTVQAVLDLNRDVLRGLLATPRPLGATRVTIQKFYLPSGASTQHRGVLADLPLASPADYFDEGESALPHALPWDEIEPIKWLPDDAQRPGMAVLDADLEAQLLARSRERQAERPEFAWLREWVAWWQARSDRKDLSLNLARRQAERAEDEARRRALEEARAQLVADAPQVRRVLLPSASAKEDEHAAFLHREAAAGATIQPNHYGPKVFYYQDEAGGPVREVWLEELDYLRAEPSANALAETLGGHGLATSPETVRELLRALDTARRLAGFRAEDTFAKVFGEAWTAMPAQEALSAFFHRLVAANPALLDAAGGYDLVLQEGLRVAADWARLRRPSEAEPGSLALQAPVPPLPGASGP